MIVDDALEQLDRVTFAGGPVVVRVAGTVGNPAWRLSDRARHELAPRLAGWLPHAARPRLVVSWARHRGRVSTTEVSDLVGIAVNAAGELLKVLEDQGHLAPGRATRLGRGFLLRADSGATRRPVEPPSQRSSGRGILALAVPARPGRVWPSRSRCPRPDGLSGVRDESPDRRRNGRWSPSFAPSGRPRVLDHRGRVLGACPLLVESPKIVVVPSKV